MLGEESFTSGDLNHAEPQAFRYDLRDPKGSLSRFNDDPVTSDSNRSSGSRLGVSFRVKFTLPRGTGVATSSTGIVFAAIIPIFA
jgi:hypothetical protein